MSKREWVIEGFDSMDRIFKIQTPEQKFSTEDVGKMLQILVAASSGAAPDYGHIFDQWATKDTNSSEFFVVTSKSLGMPQYRCGSNPHFSARIVEGQD